MGNHNLCARPWGSRLTCSSPMSTIIRAQVAHTPRNPFLDDSALEVFSDGAVAVAAGRIVACGAYRDVRAGHPEADVLDARDSILLPGFVDCHVHFPQIRVIGAMGLELLDWLRLRSLPEEARLADEAYAAPRWRIGSSVRWPRTGPRPRWCSDRTSRRPRRRCSSAASAAGLRVFSGLVVSDRGLLPELEVSAETRARAEPWPDRSLARPGADPLRGHAALRGLVLGGAAVGVRRAGARVPTGVLFTTHLNETPGEISLVGELFPLGP